MKDLTFKIGALIKKELKKNKWVMHFTNMSGDGDHYEEETFDLEDSSKLLNYLIIYATRWIMTGDRYNDNKILQAAEALASELGMKENGHDLYMDLTGPDITNEQRQAVPDEYWVTYFDENGYEHYVEIVVGEKVFHQINESNIKEVLDET